ncbi:kinesin-like protein Klp98A isoform X2 [Contarinia nasturtii]|uniref:kinesin-like protein Klp98A isoform X2 n=1 Tax=Contarinia nasturtii TaxID=265458 RepID=UPI0012D4A751|nr:kinesin-like protein Klp98A isoform X2 [Contarinia nasturtii]
MASLKVAVRVRPFNNREHEMNAKLIVQMDGKKTRLIKPENPALDMSNINANANRDHFHDFTFDFSYWSFRDHITDDHNKSQHIVSQDEVYNDLGIDVINCAFQGYNACVFAYGQTGSGKTFTMMGHDEEAGLIPRICKEMFNRMKVGQKSGTGYKTNVSYLEIYNERVKDLLGPTNGNNTLRVREHRQLGPYVEGLSQHPVSDYMEIQDCIDRGNMYRTTASTKMNDTSSRSHAIFTITFVQAIFMNNTPSETVSKIHLVDLAGSERANSTEATGDRLKEGAHINKSLVSLGSVISSLALLAEQTQSSKKKIFIPYRDSVLTWLLKDSLGGNSKTIMIAAISPADVNYNETLSTLRYANRAKNIINKPTINEDPNVKLIRELREEIFKLKGMLLTTDISCESHNKSSQMLEDLLKKEAQEKFLTEEWAEKFNFFSILREEKTLGLRKSGYGVVLDSDAPHLIGIHDGNTTGVTLYSLKEGETIIGNEEQTDDSNDERKVDIALPGTQPLHCSIVLTDCTATIYPYEGSECWLNANLINTPHPISQGDILLFGRTNMFRYCNPAEAAKRSQSGETNNRSKDLSRLSFIAASRENLSESSQSITGNIEETPENQESLDPVVLETSTDLIRKQRFDDIQEEHRKILETIENALHKLNSERNQIYQQYSLKVQHLSQKLFDLEESNADHDQILNCRGSLLTAKREMLLWSKMNKKTQIDIAVKQISTLQLQLDSKKADSHTMNDHKDVDQLKVELLEKEDALKENIKQIAELDETILIISEQQNELLRKMKKITKPEKNRTDILNRIKNYKSASIESSDVEKPVTSNISNEIEDNQKRSEMQSLLQKIAAQKDQIMKNLELNNCDKAQLDKDIATLQTLQKQYIQYEQENGSTSDCLNDCIGSDRYSIDNDYKSSITTSSQNDNMIRSQLGDVNSEYIISIPSFVMRGAGKQTHFEYEVRITLPDEKWIIMRRYSRFRELHITMKALYGEKINQIPFPSREFFSSKSESVARNRRRQLETYLRRLIVVCSKIPQCPFYEDGTNGYGISKPTLVQFSHFFKKGLFESGKYGTG